ncbi:RNA polymerase sigma factor [Dyadobacter sp. CY323]|uniref:RNA polymerase sigma factor n=1 Tax=Dyadobacter sp. CY323 TaxID=2907302 RepID=UPI001F28170B|nr:sigma-70 family RNA polymerase sigma factor [Dyadobacter sp. CY323]MCE6991744.1 sigma-70 family RNA polymerase sigma factor [Dyadobacter sp. CY323]
MQNQPDYNREQLIKQISEGSVNAFGQLYRKQHDRVYAKVLKITRCTDLAADLTQDVFLRIWEYRLRLKDVKSLEGYISAISKNVAIDALNRLARENNTLLEIRYRRSTSDEHPTNQLTIEEFNALLVQAIERLPLKRKRIFISCKVEGQSHSYVASKYGISTGTVNDHIVKATKSIRKFFKCRDA